MSAFFKPGARFCRMNLKKSILKLREWNVEDRENNSETIRAYVNDVLNAEIFKFSLAPTTTNESKTLKVLIVEEAHKCNDKKRADELDPMLTSTGLRCVRLKVWLRGWPSIR